MRILKLNSNDLYKTFAHNKNHYKIPTIFLKYIPGCINIKTMSFLERIKLNT